jgi:hypothetical protein
MVCSTALVAFAVVISLWAQDASRVPSASFLSPFDLAQSIDSGNFIDWKAVSTRIGATDNSPVLPPCGDPQYSPCSTELITVQNPPQVILLVQQTDSREDLFLRFSKEDNGWRFAGYHIAPLKYYPSRHGMMRFDSKPFLKVSVQGESGTGLASEIEEWFDLTLPEFKPVFSFLVQGHRSLTDIDIAREVYGFASQDRGSTVETIRLGLLVRFSFDDNDLGELDFSGIYERSSGDSKFQLRRAGINRDYAGSLVPMANKDFEDLTEMYPGPGIEKLLVYVLPGLQELASGTDVQTKKELKTLLEGCKNTSEKRELEALLETEE